ncbi:MAG: porin [Agarilytica sp.]
MKKQLITTLMFAGVALPAFAEPTLYGKANVSIHNADEGDASATEVVSNASRIGLKGTYDVDGGLQAIYQAEFEVQFDDGDKSGQTFSQRNIFVGLKGNFGTVKAGNFDTPLKVAQKKVDLFSDLKGDIKNVITDNDARAQNIVSYQSPSVSGFNGSVAVIASEADGVSNGVSASVTFEQDGLYFAAALDQNLNDGGISEDLDVFRLVAQYTIADIQLGALYESSDPVAGDDKDGVFGSVKYTLDKIALKAQYGKSDIRSEGGDTLSIGADYKISKPLKVFAYYTQHGADGDAIDEDYLGAGVELKF